MLQPCSSMKTPQEGEFISPADAMKWALVVARRGAGFVSPNPMVGCVIVDHEHKFVVDGWHRKVGGAHAEVDAIDRLAKLRGSREAVKGCHVYVTLEPCAHEGRTGSCAKMLAPLKPASVTYAIQDPNPLVAGQGAKILMAAGVPAVCLADARAWPAFPGKPIEAAVQIDLVEEAEDVNDIFLWCMRNQGQDARPFVTVKVASSLDGRVAMESGESKWITGEGAREQGHRLRLEHDAVVVGRRTVETDDPSMNVRLEDVHGHVNSVVLVDPKAKLVDRLREFNIAKVRPPERIFICVQKGIADPSVIARGVAQGFNVFEVGGSENGVVDLKAMLCELRRRDIRGVYVEGGGGTVGPFMDANIVNRLHVFMAMSVIGGKHSRGWSDLCGGEKLESIWKLRRARVTPIGSDIHVTGRLD